MCYICPPALQVSSSVNTLLSTLAIKKEGAAGIMDERGFHSNSPSVIDVWCLCFRMCSEICLTPVRKALLDGLSASIRAHTPFFYMVFYELVRGVGLKWYLICDTWVWRKQGEMTIMYSDGDIYGFHLCFWLSWWPRELTFFFSSSSSSSLPPSTVPQISLWFPSRGMYYFWHVDRFINSPYVFIHPHVCYL